MNRNRRSYPKIIRKDVERGFIYAYFELVRGFKVTLSDELTNNDVVAMAASHEKIIGMDFSSIYHFSEGQKPETRLKHIRRKIDLLQNFCSIIIDAPDNSLEVLYEIWCFIPPNIYVSETVEKALQEGLKVKLVGQAELHERIRQTAEIEVEDKEMLYANAFLWSAELFRQAGAWMKQKH